MAVRRSLWAHALGGGFIWAACGAGPVLAQVYIPPPDDLIETIPPPPPEVDNGNGTPLAPPPSVIAPMDAEQARVEGGHDWAAWMPLWERFLDAGHFKARA